MSSRPTDPLLLAGRVLTFIMQGLMALGGAALVAALPFMIFLQDRITGAIQEQTGNPELAVPMFALILIVILGIGALVLAFRFFGKLRQIIETVEEGDPFVPDNADRLTAMAWHLTAIYGLFAVMAIIAIGLSPFIETIGDGESSISFGIELSTILTIVILFILARVFRKGTEMREDLEGTV